jgi:hypothetical protein
MAEVRHSRATWRKSSYSGANGDCIEVTDAAAGIVDVRDSKNPDGPKLAFTPDQWTAFTCSLNPASR